MSELWTEWAIIFHEWEVMNHQAYIVRWKYVTACELLNEEYPSLSSVSLHDSNAYTVNRIVDHHVVVACLSKGRYEIVSVVMMTKNMLRFFESIRIELMMRSKKKRQVRNTTFDWVMWWLNACWEERKTFFRTSMIKRCKAKSSRSLKAWTLSSHFY